MHCVPSGFRRAALPTGLSICSRRLDEATASIDAASQQRIIPAIRRFMQGKTTLMITHSPELIRHADMVVQLRDGRTTWVRGNCFGIGRMHHKW